MVISFHCLTLEDIREAQQTENTTFSPFCCFRILIREGVIGTFGLSAMAVLGVNSTDTDGEARWTPGPEGRWVGGCHLRRQHQHQDQDPEEISASAARLGAPIQPPVHVTVPYLRAHQL